MPHLRKSARLFATSATVGLLAMAGSLAANNVSERATSDNSASHNDGQTHGASMTDTQTAMPLIPRDALFGNPTKAQGRLSPDGKFVSWLAPKDGVLNIWVALQQVGADRGNSSR